MTNLDGLVFKGNTISYSGTFPQLHPENPVLRVEASKNIKFDDNIYKGRDKKTLETNDSLSNTIFE